MFLELCEDDLLNDLLKRKNYKEKEAVSIVK